MTASGTKTAIILSSTVMTGLARCLVSSGELLLGRMGTNDHFVLSTRQPDSLLLLLAVQLPLVAAPYQPQGYGIMTTTISLYCYQIVFILSAGF